MSVKQRLADLRILERVRAEWILWLGFTTSLNPYAHDRTPAARRADAAMCRVVNGEPTYEDFNPAPRGELS